MTQLILCVAGIVFGLDHHTSNRLCVLSWLVIVIHALLSSFKPAKLDLKGIKG